MKSLKKTPEELRCSLGILKREGILVVKPTIFVTKLSSIDFDRSRTIDDFMDSIFSQEHAGYTVQQAQSDRICK